MTYCLNHMLSQPSISTGTELELWIGVGSRLFVLEGRYHMTVWNWFYAVFLTLKKCDRGGNTFWPILVVELVKW